MVMVVVVVVVVVVEGADAPQTTARPAENFRSGSIAEEDARVDMPARGTAGRGHSVALVRRAGTTNAFAHAMVRIASKRGFPYSLFLSFVLSHRPRLVPPPRHKFKFLSDTHHV
jgi:hypothetical protein